MRQVGVPARNDLPLIDAVKGSPPRNRPRVCVPSADSVHSQFELSPCSALCVCCAFSATTTHLPLMPTGPTAARRLSQSGLSRVSSKQVTIVRRDHRFEARVHAEAAQNRTYVIADGVDRNDELVGNLLGGTTACEHLENLRLTWGQ